MPVTPYFVVGNETIQVVNDQLLANFTIKKITESARLDQVKLFVNKSILTDHVLFDQEISVDLSKVVLGTETRITAQLSNNLKDKDYVFARLGVKSSSSGEYIYTPVQRINLK
ncbi:hypothetical protein D3C86_1955280 [compost metagenome]